MSEYWHWWCDYLFETGHRNNSIIHELNRYIPAAAAFGGMCIGKNDDHDVNDDHDDDVNDDDDDESSSDKDDNFDDNELYADNGDDDSDNGWMDGWMDEWDR